MKHSPHRAPLLRPAARLLGLVCVSTSVHGTSQAPKPADTQDATDTISFDLGRLKGRKLDPRQVQLFSRSARFLSGPQRVTLFVNGSRQGEMTAVFNRDGQLCFDSRLLAQAKLVAPEEADNQPLPCDTPDAVDPLGFLARHSQTVADLRPGKSEVHLIVPAEALQPRLPVSRQFHSGGTAALLNYDGFAVQNQSSTRSTQFRYLNTVVGFNTDDWLFRSAQSYVGSTTGRQITHSHAYGQRTFSSLDATFQGGQINLANSVFAGIPLFGLQLVPEDSLRAGAEESPVRIEGIARSPARVEVRQNGNLIRTLMIPEGPFLLTELELNRRLDVLVTVIENSGERSSFTLPSASLDSSAFNSTPGYAFAAGQYRPGRNSQSETPLLLSATGTWPLTPQTQITAGALASSSYQGVSGSMGHRLTPQTALSLSQSLSSSIEDAQRGTLLSASLSTRLLDRLSLGLHTTHQTEGYRDFLDTVYRAEEVEEILDNGNPTTAFDAFKGRNRDQYGLSLGWGNTPMGSFSLTTSYSRRFDGQSSQYLSGSWSMSYKRATFNLNLQKNLSNNGNENQGLNTFLNISVPFGDHVRTYASADKNGTRSGLALRDQPSDSVGYQVRAEHDDTHHRTSLSVSTQLLPRYAQANLGYTRSSAETTSYNARLSGAVVAHGNGLTLSPYLVDDTFSVLSVGDLSGVKIATPRGPVWTDMLGQAIAPGLPPHRDSQMTVNAATLPRNVDISNSVKKLKPSRGSVNRIEFDVSSTRRTLLVVKDAHGVRLPKGLAVLNEHQQYVTTTLGEGKLYFPSLEPGATLNVLLSNEQQCQIQYVQPRHADPSLLIETIEATCKAL